MRPATHSALTLLVVLTLLAASRVSHAQTASDPTPEQVARPEPEQPVRTIKEWDLPKRGQRLAIKGYDPVAYFDEGGGKPTRGEKSIAASHEGVVYRFATHEHRELFLANPARYEPAHGGWCSWAMLDGDKTRPDPRSFIVKEDRLFLFYDSVFVDTRAGWLRTTHEQSADAADRQWLAISGEIARREEAKLPAAPG